MKSHGIICGSKILHEEHTNAVREIENMKKEILSHDEKIAIRDDTIFSLEKVNEELRNTINDIEKEKFSLQLKMAKLEGYTEMAKIQGASKVYSNLLKKKDNFLMEIIKKKARIH
jgi:hypothetical protein